MNCNTKFNMFKFPTICFKQVYFSMKFNCKRYIKTLNWLHGFVPERKPNLIKRVSWYYFSVGKNGCFVW